MKTVAFHIFGKSAERTAYLMRKVLRRYPFLRFGVEGGRCVISSDQVNGSLNGWLIDRLLKSRRFLGRYHRSHPLYDADRTEAAQDRYHTCLCRFGYWDSVDATPEDMRHFEWSVRKMTLRLRGLPDYRAALRATRETGHDPHPPGGDGAEEEAKHWVRRGYIAELVKRYGYDPAEAQRRVDRHFKRYDVPLRPREPVDPEVRRANAERQGERMNEMMSILKFLGCPKERRRWLRRNDDFLGDLFLRFVLAKHGREWFVEKIGEIEGIT